MTDNEPLSRGEFSQFQMRFEDHIKNQEEYRDNLAKILKSLKENDKMIFNRLWQFAMAVIISLVGLAGWLATHGPIFAAGTPS